MLIPPAANRVRPPRPLFASPGHPVNLIDYQCRALLPPRPWFTNMRKILLVILTVLVLAGGLGLFLWFQGDVPLPTNLAVLTPATRPGSIVQGIGKGEGAWVMTYDQKTGLPLVRFRAQRYVPQSGQQVDVDHPQAEFFIGPKRNQVIRIEGKTGTIVLAGDAPRLRSDLSSAPIQTPRRGLMRDVTITYFPSQEALLRSVPELTVTLNNAYFDNDTFEIATEAFTDAQGNQIAGQDVPVQVRGEAVDFDGKGLYIRWDDRSQRLKSLTVHRSERMVIKKPFARPGTTEGMWPDHQQAMAAPAPSGNAGNAGNAPVGAAGPAGKEDATPAYYRATLRDNVTVTQGNQQLASGGKMEIDFIASDSRPARPAQPEAASPSGSPAWPSAQSSAPENATPQSPDKPGIAQSPLNGKDPIVVRWAGEMTVTPILEREPIVPETANDAVVRLTGVPVILQSPGYRIEATSANYLLSRQFAWVDGSAGLPVRMTDSHDSLLLTPQLRFDQKQGIATLNGISSATMISDQDGKKTTLTATWKDKAQAFFANPGSPAPTISRLVLQGNVNVQHPRVRKFTAQSLALDFPPAGANPQAGPTPSVQQITARTNVECILLDDAGQPKPIRCQLLRLRFAEGDDRRSFPSGIDAQGDVVAGDDTQQIKADAIVATLNSKAQSAQNGPSAELAGLKDLVATGNVEVRSPQVELVQAQRLEVKPQGPGEAWLLLEGTAAKPALVVRAGGTSISGKLIEVNSKQQSAIITGGGRMTLPGKAVSPSADARNPAASLPVEVTWTGDGRLDGQKNTARLEDNVYVKYIDNDGSVNEATGDRVEITLAVNPKATPTKKTQQGEAGFLADRYVRQLSLLGLEGHEIQLQSLKMVGSFIDRQVNIFGPRMDCDFSTQGLETLTVPANRSKPSRMLYVSMLPGTRKVVKTEDPFKSTDLPGTTAFSWNQALTYDRAKSALALTGAVLIRHKPQTAGGLTFDIMADSLLADLQTAPSTPSSPGKTGNQPLAQLHKLVLTGNPVQIDRQDVLLTCPTVEIYPATSDVVAIGTERNPVRVEKGKDVGTFKNVYLNTETQSVRAVGVTGLGRR